MPSTKIGQKGSIERYKPNSGTELSMSGDNNNPTKAKWPNNQANALGIQLLDAYEGDKNRNACLVVIFVAVGVQYMYTKYIRALSSDEAKQGSTQCRLATAVCM